MMTEEETLLIHAYVDGEMSPGETLAMERRLVAEPALRAAADQLRDLSGALGNALADVAVPEGFRDRMLAAVDAQAPQRIDGPQRSPMTSSWERSRPLAASLLVGLLLGGLAGGGTMRLWMGSSDPSTAEQVLAGHLRALAAPQPFDIASSDRHVVKPWFNGRTIVAPTAPDLADKAFPLIGGRVDVVAGRAVPTLVYRHDRHLISVTVVRGALEISSGEDHRDGSTLEHWQVGDLTFWAVSDLNAPDLRGFVDLFRARTAGESSFF